MSEDTQPLETTSSPVTGYIPSASTAQSNTNSTQNQVNTYLKHLLKLVLWSAASVIVVTVIASLSSFDLRTIPPQYQTIAGILLPILISALSNTKNEINSQLQVEQAQKAMVEAKQEAAVAKSALRNAE